MDENSFVPIKQRPWFYAVRGTLIFFATLILYSITVYRVRVTYISDTLQFADIPVWAINLISVVILGFIYNSILMLTSMHDKFASDLFYEEGKEELFVSKELSIIIKDKKFWIETVTVLVLCTFAVIFGGFSTISKSLPEYITANLPGWLLPILYCFVVFFLISLWCKYEARRYWVAQKIKKETEVIGSPVKIVFRCIAISIVYPFIFPYAPLLVLASFTVFNIAREASEYFGIIGFIALIIFVIFLVIAIKYLSAVKSRKKFIRDLRRFAEENQYILSEIYNPVASIFRHYDGYSFLLKKDKREFTCRLLATVNKRTPVIFTSNESGYYRHRIGGKKHHLTLQHKFDYGFDKVGDSVKILIVQPYPKTIFVESDGSSRRMQTGDKIWDVVVYDPQSFLGAIDRDCLGRYNGRYD